MKLILASSSPRRADVLRNAGIKFEVRAIPIDESRNFGEPARDYVQRLALAKARAAAGTLDRAHEHFLVIAADTTVVIGGEILAKPESEAHARQMLRRLSGTWHEVHTGLALLRHVNGEAARAAGPNERVIEEITRVQLAPLSESELDAYIATNDWTDKAGSYAIQGVGGRYVTRLEGCYFNVVGLPLARLWLLLKEFGWERPASQVADA